MLWRSCLDGGLGWGWCPPKALRQTGQSSPLPEPAKPRTLLTPESRVSGAGQGEGVGHLSHGGQASGHVGICDSACISASITPHPPPPPMPRPDLDECQVRSLCQHACRNTEGSYRCLCPAGYRLLPSGKNCQGELLPRRQRGQGRGLWAGAPHAARCPAPSPPPPPCDLREGRGTGSEVPTARLGPTRHAELRWHRQALHALGVRRSSAVCPWATHCPSLSLSLLVRG